MARAKKEFYRGFMLEQLADSLCGMEPYRVRVVEPLRFTTPAEREAALERANFNLYALHAGDVLIDLLTDSGTCAISGNQMAAMMQGDESYAGSASFFRMERAIRELFAIEHVIPVHQGRAAERLLLQTLAAPGSLLPSNTLFDTTRANCLDLGIRPVDLPVAGFWDFDSADPFKGNIDLDALEKWLSGPEAARIPFVLLTITNNICADQPVSMQNLRRAGEIAHRHGKPLFLDACRFAQNAWFIQQYEEGYEGRAIRAIVAEIFSHADGCFVSAKKDAMAQIGGFLAVRSAALAAQLRQRLLLAEGFVTYGGMTGRDMEAVAAGLYEGTEAGHLGYRMEMTRYLHQQLQRRGIAVLSPPGGHAVYLPVAGILPHLAAGEQPGQALAVELYREGGIRSTRMILRPDHGPRAGECVELLRLALPNRVYSARHMDYVAVCLERVLARASAISGMAIVSQPELLGGFMAQYQQLPMAACAGSSGDRGIL